ncbi:MAG: type II secretion system F family protein [Candidatus Micrarchaeota archaeon]|nr:type II secretion system F family protein [Candidatus Micrarchaeota archaeon]
MNAMEKYQKAWAQLLTYNDIDLDPRQFTYLVFFASLAIGLIAISIMGVMKQPTAYSLVAGILAFAAAQIIAYIYLLLAAQSRAAKVEEILPDFLSLMASNIRSGLTPDKALVVSVQEEFGPLAVEIERAGKSSLTGKPINEVLLGIVEHIDSDALRKTIYLIVEGLQSGGDIVELLEKTAQDMRKSSSLKRETSSIILNYVLFIIAAISLGAPLLYGVSTFLVDIMLKIKQKLAVTGGEEAKSAMSGQVGIFKGQLQLTSDAVALFAVASIVITVFFGCMAVGVMHSGKKLDGIKYFPLLLAVALGILFAIRWGLGQMLGSFVN